MQSFFFGDGEAGVRAARSLMNLPYIEDINKTFSLDILHLSEKLAYEMFDHLSENHPEAKYNKAMMIFDTQPETTDEAYKILDSMILESWNGDIDEKNFAPAASMKYYHLINSFFE